LAGLIARVEDLLKAGDAAAVELAGSGAETYPDSGKLAMLHGVALGQAGRIDEAISELRRATMLDPSDAETFFNLAVQLYDAGDRQEASLAAKEALKLHPTHEAATELLAQCEVEAGEVNFEVEKVEVRPSDASLRTGPDSQPKPLLNLGPAWTYVGYGVLVLCLASSILLLVHNPLALNPKTSLIRHDLLSVFSLFLHIVTGLMAMFWMLVDIIDRRDRFVWLLPIWICCFVGIPFLPLALYMFVGRRLAVFRGVN
jgi:tetratricopeptide (TPR) repeat protein